MSRIQQILAKAERDGTARRIGALEEPPMPETPATSYVSPAVFQSIGTTDVDARDVVSRGTTPAGGADPVQERPASQGVSQRRSARVPVEATPNPLLVAALEPLSPAAEQYRSLRSRIGRAESTQPLRVIQITSPGTHDGKTVTALNLALTMAQEFQQRVLVMDTDLRTPGVHELLGVPPGPGLVDVLTGEATLEDALIEIAGHHLTVLPAGRPYDRPAEMLGSAPMRRLVDTLRSQFDRIVIDSGPATVADPAAVATLADTLVLVVRAGTTTKPAIARAIQALGSAKLLGLVFNASGTLQHTPYAASA